MISHTHKSIFTDIPGTQDGDIRPVFGLPPLGRDYVPDAAFEVPYGHHELRQMRKYGCFRDYFKFAFVRHPLDRLVSSFFYLNAGGANDGDKRDRDRYLAKFNGDFPAFVENLEGALHLQHFSPQYDWIYDRQARRLTDFTGRFETLEKDVEFVGRKIGLETAGMKRVNPSTHGHWETYYSDRTRAIAEKVYRKDMSIFEYDGRGAAGGVALPVMRDIIEAAGFKSAGNRVILTFANDDYVDVVRNWLAALDRLSISNVLVISLDPGIDAKLKADGVASVLLPFDGDFGGLWCLRIEIFRALLDAGIGFIHSDADAVWLRDPVSRFFSDPRFDIVSSQGTIQPRDTAANWGFVLCCGLIGMRPGPAIGAFLDDLKHNVLRTRSDQRSLNWVLEAHDVSWDWPQSRVERVTYRGQEMIFCDDIVSGRCPQSGLRVAALPHHLFQRHHMPDRPAYVKHLITPKVAADKMQMLAETGCLFLPA